MERILTLVLAFAFCLGLAATSIDAKPRYGISTSRSDWRGVHSWLGVYTQSVDDDLADAFDIDVDYGAIINEVIDDSPAEDAGLKDGDVIISFNGRKVWDKDDLIDFLEDAEPGSSAELVIMRNRKEMNMNVELGKRPRTTVVVPKAPRAPQAFWYNDDDNNVETFFSFHGHGYVGVQLAELTDQIAKYFGVKDGKGALITEVFKDSPAEKAGLKAGDVITKIDNKIVKNYSEVKEIVATSEEGDKLAFEITRNKKTQKIEVEVDEGDTNDYGYGYYTVPPVPDVDISFPKGIARFNLDDKNDNAYFDFDNYKESMEKFREEMKRYKDEIRELSREMNKLKKDDERSELQEQIKELKEQIRKLERELR